MIKNVAVISIVLNKFERALVAQRQTVILQVGSYYSKFCDRVIGKKCFKNFKIRNSSEFTLKLRLLNCVFNLKFQVK